MAKHLTGQINKDHVVTTEIEGFSYQMDWLDVKEVDQVQAASPTGVLIAALAGCSLITAQSFLSKKRYNYEILQIDIQGEYIKEDPYTRLKAQVTMTTDAKLDTEGLEKLTEFIEKYCTVSRVLSSGNDIETHIQIV